MLKSLEIFAVYSVEVRLVLKLMMSLVEEAAKGKGKIIFIWEFFLNFCMAFQFPTCGRECKSEKLGLIVEWNVRTPFLELSPRNSPEKYFTSI